MNIKSVSCMLFSPTGSTKTILKSIAKGMQTEQVEFLDCTNRARRNQGPFPFKGDLAILGVPVYYGRVPEEVASFLKTLSGQNKPVVLVVVYGNREYEDALLELHDISKEREFIPIAGGAFVAEHSYSLPSRPIAHGRPDLNDIEKAKNFGLQIQQKIQALESLADLENLHVPGNRPYTQPVNLEMIKQARTAISLTPETDDAKCTKCGLCAQVCPTNAIDPNDVSRINKWECMICFACVKSCPESAKQMTDPNFNQAIGQLQLACQERKEPEIFL